MIHKIKNYKQKYYLIYPIFKEKKSSPNKINNINCNKQNQMILKIKNYKQKNYLIYPIKEKKSSQNKINNINCN